MLDFIETVTESGAIRDLDLSQAHARREGEAIEVAMGRSAGADEV